MSNHEGLQDQIGQLTAERDALKHQVDRLRTRTDRRRTLRAVAVGLLVALACLTFTGATVGVWAKRSVLNDKVWAKRVDPLGKDPAVHDAMATWLTNELMEVIEPAKLFSEVLPDKGQILAVPLESALAGFVHDQIVRFMETDAFAELWSAVSNTTHEQVVRVIEGRSPVITGREGQIVINFVPLINALLAELTDVTPELFGVSVSIPQLSVDDLPDSAQEQLSEALGLPVTDEFGIIQVDDGGKLEAIQRAVRISQAAVWALVVASVLFTIAALWLSPRRRRTLLQLLSGFAIGMVVVRRAGMLADRETLEMIVDPTARAAAESVLNQFINPLIKITTTFLWVFLIIAAAVLITGPYKWAESLRPQIATVGATTVGMAKQAGSRVTDDATITWLRTNTGTLQIVGVAALLAILMLTNLGWFGTIVVLAIFALYQAGAWWLGESARRASESGDTAGDPGDTAEMSGDTTGSVSH